MAHAHTASRSRSTRRPAGADRDGGSTRADRIAAARPARPRARSAAGSRGGRSASSSWRTHPIENESLAVSGGAPSACSGAMYSGVPTADPSKVRASGTANAASRALATPKSMMRTRGRPSSSDDTSTLAGLRSRWMTPRRCACSTASQACIASATRSRTPSPRSRAKSVTGSPATNAIANHGRPSGSSPESSIAAIPGWSRPASSCRSARIRAAASGDAVDSRRTFTATSRRTGDRCWPRNTSPKAPAPIGCSSTYRPTEPSPDSSEPSSSPRTAASAPSTLAPARSSAASIASAASRSASAAPDARIQPARRSSGTPSARTRRSCASGVGSSRAPGSIAAV